MFFEKNRQNILILEREDLLLSKKNDRKKVLDKRRNEWRKKHRTLNGKIILYSDKQPEHVNARASKNYNWFWKNILLPSNKEDIPAIISNIKEQIKACKDKRKTRVFRTMIAMAEDAYKLKGLESIDSSDSEIGLGENVEYSAEQGLFFKNGKIFSTDFNENEDMIIIRDQEGVIVDIQYNGRHTEEKKKTNALKKVYENWDYVSET